MRHIEIVTHCYCPPKVTHYAEHLRWQFASLAFHSQEKVTWSVCHSPEDNATCSILALCRSKNKSDSGIEILPIELELGELFRRSIGRNLRAKATKADIVWFTDVDYCFGPKCLDTVAELVDLSEEFLYYPNHTWLSRSHGRGEMVIDSNEKEMPLVTSVSQHFKQLYNVTAIGGIQIVTGSFARREGYMNRRKKWQTPVDPQDGFLQCRCDVAFRRSSGLTKKRIDVPNLYRFRHSVAGRDLDLDGNVIEETSNENQGKS